MEDKQVEHLLTEVNAMSTKYDFMYKTTGEYFNVFDIVGYKPFSDKYSYEAAV